MVTSTARHWRRLFRHLRKLTALELINRICFCIVRKNVVTLFLNIFKNNLFFILTIVENL